MPAVSRKQREYPHLPIWQEEHLLRLANEHRKKRISRNCKQCNKEFFARGWRNYEPKFCSYSCHNLFMIHHPLILDSNPNWKGGKRIDRRGYVIFTTPEGIRYEHRTIAENVLCRTLKKDETVHHINGNPKDNRNENLLICTSGYHHSLHHLMSKKYQEVYFAQ